MILARTDLPTSQMKLSNVQEENFATNLVLPIGEIGTFTVTRGWNSVDVKLRGKDFRFVNAHLEDDVVPIQAAQAAELLAGPVNIDTSVILVGDFNSPANRPGSPSYNLLVGAGLDDAWTASHPGEPGYTYGNDPDLLNSEPLTLDPQRIDLVLHRGDVTTRSMDRAGEELVDRTPSGLWPSDHAGVVATLGIHIRPADANAYSLDALFGAISNSDLAEHAHAQTSSSSRVKGLPIETIDLLFAAVAQDD
ncbi:MAG: hypothetical protein HQ567_06120 [Candidatus Nealsonbacteria bacterium]|nr:hypothetical protein [Candidatus Nealsonbacteria bacterium]